MNTVDGPQGPGDGEGSTPGLGASTDQTPLIDADHTSSQRRPMRLRPKERGWEPG